MLSLRDQENIVHAQQTTAAAKPQNQTLRSLQPKTPANATRTPFRPRNDENNILQTAKDSKKAVSLATPAPLTSRAPLAAKTTNAKAQQFKTPAPAQKASKLGQATHQLSSTRRSTKKKIHVAPTETTQSGPDDAQEDPDYGTIHPQPTPLPDPPLEITYDESFPQFEKENMLKGFGDIYYASPKDENGISLSWKHQNDLHAASLAEETRKLDQMLEQELNTSKVDPDEQVARLLSSRQLKPKVSNKTQESTVATIKARSAASALSERTEARDRQHRLPAAATAETTTSMLKKKIQKSTFSADNSRSLHPKAIPATRPSTHLSVSKNTIGFPKARKPPSIIPRDERTSSTSRPTPALVAMDPSEFVRLHGEPPVESDMWFRLQESRLRAPRADESIFDDPADPAADLDAFRIQLDSDLDEDDFQL